MIGNKRFFYCFGVVSKISHQKTRNNCEGCSARFALNSPDGDIVTFDPGVVRMPCKAVASGAMAFVNQLKSHC